jgi:hypothetical protein
MQHPFAALEPEYLALMANMRVTRAPAVDAFELPKCRGVIDEG